MKYFGYFHLSDNRLLVAHLLMQLSVIAGELLLPVIFKIKGNSSHGSWLCPLASLVTLTFGKLTGTNLTAFTCILKTKTEETYRMDVAIHRSCRFSYLGNTLRPNLRVLTGRNATKALHSVEHICKNGLCVEFAWLQFLQAKSLFHCLISRWDQVYKKCRMNQWSGALQATRPEIWSPRLQMRHPWLLLGSSLALHQVQKIVYYLSIFFFAYPLLSVD